MNKNNARIRTIVFSNHSWFEKYLCQMLHSEGFTQIIKTTELGNFNQAILSYPVDLLISFSVSGSFFVGNLIRELRQGRIGKHPFPIVLMLVQSSNEQHINAVLNSGVDDIVQVPVSGNTFLRRVMPFTLDRRPFIVTYDYIGPERRQGLRHGKDSAPIIQVPNTLKAKVDGIADATIEHDIQEATRAIDRCKIGQNAQQLSWLVERLREEMNEPKRERNTLHKLMQGVDNSTTDIARRAIHSSEKSLRENALAVSTASRNLCLSDDITLDPRLSHTITISDAFAQHLAKTAPHKAPSPLTATAPS